MPESLTSQAALLSYTVIPAGKMTYGFLPTCVQTNQLWPADSRSYHICESETTFLGALLLAYPPGRLCRTQEQGAACCWGTEHFRQPGICLFTTMVPYERSHYLELTQDRWMPSACRCCCLQKSIYRSWSADSPSQLTSIQLLFLSQTPIEQTLIQLLGYVQWRTAAVGWGGGASREWS